MVLVKWALAIGMALWGGSKGSAAIVHAPWPTYGDLNLDGLVDFTRFWEAISTADIPVSFSSQDFGIRTAANFISASGSNAKALDLGTVVGPGEDQFSW